MEQPLTQYDAAEFRRLGARRRMLKKQLDNVMAKLSPHIAAARAAGVPVDEIREVTGIESREHIRKTARDHGVEAPETWSRTRRQDG